jgi:hypothetical protein
MRCRALGPPCNPRAVGLPGWAGTMLRPRPRRARNGHANSLASAGILGLKALGREARHAGAADELAHHGREVAKADRVTARIVDGVLRFVGEQDQGEHLSGVVNMDRSTHGVAIREEDGLAARGLRDAIDVID